VKENRVVVTGMGAVTPIGVGLVNFWQGLISGRNGIQRVTHFDPAAYRSQMAAEVKAEDFETLKWIDKKTFQRFDRFSNFSIAAAVMAFQNSGLAESNYDATKAGVILGSGIGGALTIQEGMKKLLEKGPSAISPFFIPAVLINMGSSLVSIRLGFKGPLAAPSVACSTGGNAIGEAYRMIQRGNAVIMAAGSAEAAINPLPYAGFCSLRAMSTRNDDVQRASRPFDKNRDGFVMGEGSGVVILEELEHARARGAHIYAELIGYGNTADAYHFTAPQPQADGMVRVIQEALDDAGISAEQVQHINAHGTSTPLNDQAECLAIKKVFANSKHNLKITSIKSMIGHLLAAAGSVEFIATVMSVVHGIIPPTINTAELDDACDLNIVLDEAQRADIKIAATNNFGFGGGNASLIVRKYQG